MSRPALAISHSCSASPSIDRSAGTTTTSTPNAARRSAASASSTSARRAEITRSSPSAAARRANSRPSPSDAPVISAQPKAQAISAGDAGQFLALHPFQEGPAGGRDEGEISAAPACSAPPPYRRRPRPRSACPASRQPRGLGAAALVAASKGGISKAPSGPFQISVRALPHDRGQPRHGLGARHPGSSHRRGRRWRPRSRWPPRP
jgi:hypothetical protein